MAIRVNKCCLTALGAHSASHQSSCKNTKKTSHSHNTLFGQLLPHYLSNQPVAISCRSSWQIQTQQTGHTFSRHPTIIPTSTMLKSEDDARMMRGWCEGDAWKSHRIDYPCVVWTQLAIKRQIYIINDYQSIRSSIRYDWFLSYRHHVVSLRDAEKQGHRWPHSAFLAWGCRQSRRHTNWDSTSSRLSEKQSYFKLEPIN